MMMMIVSQTIKSELSLPNEPRIDTILLFCIATDSCYIFIHNFSINIHIINTEHQQHGSLIHIEVFVLLATLHVWMVTIYTCVCQPGYW